MYMDRQTWPLTSLPNGCCQSQLWASAFCPWLHAQGLFQRLIWPHLQSPRAGGAGGIGAKTKPLPGNVGGLLTTSFPRSLQVCGLLAWAEMCGSMGPKRQVQPLAETCSRPAPNATIHIRHYTPKWKQQYNHIKTCFNSGFCVRWTEKVDLFFVRKLPVPLIPQYYWRTLQVPMASSYDWCVAECLWKPWQRNGRLYEH